MTFTDKPPTTRGFYAWKSTESSTQPIARYLCELQFYVGLRCAQSGMAPAQIGGLWCRLVPAEESNSWELLKRIKELENVIGVLVPREMAAQHKRLAEEVKKAFTEGWNSCACSTDNECEHNAFYATSRARRVATGEE